MKKNLLLLIFLFVCSTITFGKTVSPVSFGATVNDNSCDDQAIQSAVNDVKSNGGGTVEFPAGVLNLCNGVSLIDYNNYVSYKFVGTKGSEIAVSMGADKIGFASGNVNQLVIEDLIFTGKNVQPGDPQFVDCKNLFFFNYTSQIVIKNSQFYGIWCSESVIESWNAELSVEHSYFGGTLATLGVIHSKNFGGLFVKKTAFIDYGHYKDKFWAKSGMTGSSWIYAENDTMPGVNAAGFQNLMVENSRFDEGNSRALILKNLPYAIITGIVVNVSSMDGAVAIEANNVKVLELSFSQFGYTQRETPALLANNGTKATVKGLRFGGEVFLGKADTNSSITQIGPDF